MITSLLVHEFRRTRGMLTIVLGGAALLVLGGSLLILTGWNWVASFGMAVGIMAVFGMLPVLSLALAIDYWRSAYGRSGYLTHSLPVKGSTIYAVRLVYALILSIVGVVLLPVLALPLAMAALSLEVGASGDPWGQLMRVADEMLAQGAPLGLSLIVAFVILMVWFGVVTFYFAASIGSGSRVARLGLAGPIVVYVLLYVVMQVLPFVGIVALPWGIGDRGNGLELIPVDWWAAAASNQDVNAMPVGFIPIYALLALALIAWTARAWNRDVTLR